VPDLSKKSINASTNSLRGQFSYTPTMAGYVSVSECDSEVKRNYRFTHLLNESVRTYFYTLAVVWVSLYFELAILHNDMHD
jgi:hypothetical protein